MIVRHPTKQRQAANKNGVSLYSERFSAGGTLMAAMFQRRRRLLFAGKLHWNSFRHGRCELQNIPIRQTHAPVRLRLADFARLRSTVNAISFTGETNPNEPNGVIGTGLDSKRLCGPHPFKRIGRIVMIRGIFTYIVVPPTENASALGMLRSLPLCAGKLNAGLGLLDTWEEAASPRTREFNHEQ